MVDFSFWRSGKDYDIESESKVLRQYGEPWLKLMLNSEELNTDKPLVVDFGCWAGRHLRLLERVAESQGADKANERVIGIDEKFATKRLDEARKAHKGFTINDSGIASTGLPASSVDAAISWRVLHNLVKPGEWTNALMEVRKVLKHNAPFVVAVRAVRDWMPQNSPVPLKYMTYSFGNDREDLYFSDTACYAMFQKYGFDTPYKAMLFTEEEVVNGKRIANSYWLLCMVCNKRNDIDPNSKLKLPKKNFKDI